MSTLIQKLESAQLRKIPQFDAGDRVRVHFQVVEGNRRRTQVFEGFIIKRQGSGARETFTVRKQSFGVGVERTFPVHSPKIEQIEVAARGEVRRAKLYYLRDRIGKAARVRERAWAPQDAQGSIEDAELVAPTAETEVEEGAEAATATDEAIETAADETKSETSDEQQAAETPEEPAAEAADESAPEPESEPESSEPESDAGDDSAEAESESDAASDEEPSGETS